MKTETLSKVDRKLLKQLSKLSQGDKHYSSKIGYLQMLYGVEKL